MIDRMTAFLAGMLWLALAAPPVPCPEGAECRFVQVPEDRARPTGRRLDLFVVRLPATGAEPAEGAVLYLEGGLGGAASEAAADLPDLLAVLRPRRDLVFVDQRGTGRSHALTCPGPFRSRVELGELSPEDVRACREVLERRADLRRYTTWDAVEDLEEVRKALGYGKIDLFGASYGTQVAQAYLRRHADRVRSAVLVGALPLAPEPLLFEARCCRAGSIRSRLRSGESRWPCFCPGRGRSSSPPPATSPRESARAAWPRASWSRPMPPMPPIPPAWMPAARKRRSVRRSS